MLNVLVAHQLQSLFVQEERRVKRLQEQHARTLQRWRWLSPMNIPWIANAFHRLNRRRSSALGLTKRPLSATDVKGNVEILMQLQEYNRLVDRANDLERMNRSYRQHRQKSWFYLAALPVVSGLFLVIAFQNLANDAVLCSSEQSFCWWFRWDEEKRVIQ